MVAIVSGANESNAEIAGQTVGATRTRFAQALNISAGARVTVNGQAGDENYVLRNGDRLVFTQVTAEKG